MEAVAKLRYARISPRKVKIVLDLIRNKPVGVAMGILNPEDRPAMAKGILCGIVTIPVGVFIGGIVAGFNIGMVTKNLIPIIIIAKVRQATLDCVGSGLSFFCIMYC